MSIKAIALGSVIALSSIFGGVSEAQAAECSYGNGYKICLTSNGGNNWDVSFQNNHTTENMTVQCNGKSLDSYDSYGGLSKSEADYLARFFCSL